MLNLSAFTGTNITFTLEVKDDGVGGSANYGTVWNSGALTAVQTIFVWFDESNLATPTQSLPPGQLPSTLVAQAGHPLLGGTYRLRWAGTFTSATFSAVAYMKTV